MVFRVDRYALTANNISYATAGDMIGYWRFFPAEEGWGRLPCFARDALDRAQRFAGAGPRPVSLAEPLRHVRMVMSVRT
ncbi:MAG: DUF2855 family protein [Myxococcota bacterium]